MSSISPAIPAHVELVSTFTGVTFPAEWYEINSKEHFWFTWRVEAMKCLMRSVSLPASEPLRAIDVGCGTGVLRDQIEAFTAWKIDALDLNLAALSRSQPGRGRTLYYDVVERRAEFLGMYDVAILFDVIEHIDHPHEFLQAVLQHLKPGGWILINVPALEACRSRFDTAVGHLRRYTLPQLAEAARRADIAVRDVRYWGFSMVPLLILRKFYFKLRPSGDDAAIVQRGLRPPGALANTLLKQIMWIETALLQHPPLGSSLLLAGQFGKRADKL